MEFTWNNAALTELLNGPIMNNLIQRAIRVEAQAKQNATGRPGPNVRTGRLRGSITWVPKPVSGASVTGIHGPAVDIGTAVQYAPFVELGHNVVRNGVIVGHAPPRPFLVPALAAARST